MHAQEPVCYTAGSGEAACVLPSEAINPKTAWLCLELRTCFSMQCGWLEVVAGVGVSVHACVVCVILW